MGRTALYVLAGLGAAWVGLEIWRRATRVGGDSAIDPTTGGVRLAPGVVYGPPVTA